jgi:hypothetical protein
MRGSDLPHPDLGVRMPGEETIRSRDLVPVHLVVGGLDINEHVFTLSCRVETRKHLTLIDLVTAPGDFLATVPTLP